MTWRDLESDLGELFSDERVDWSPKNLSVFDRAMPRGERPPAIDPTTLTRGDWVVAALMVSRAGKIAHRVEAIGLLAAGVSIRRAAHLLGLDHKTVRRWAHEGRDIARCR